MKLRNSILSILLLFALVLTGCSNEASIDKVVDFGKEQDLSIYYVQDEDTKDEDGIELRSSLNYVDTDYLMKLKDGTGEVSKSRKTYEESPKDWDFVIVDTRRADFFDRGHINGAINIPVDEFAKAKGKLPKNKNTLLIFYGNSNSEAAADSAEKAIELGYKDVHVYQDGVEGWQENNNYLAVTSNYAKYYIMEAAAVNPVKSLATFVDTSSYKSYFKQHIPNATHIDNENFAQKFVGTVPQNKNSEIITYCSGFDCNTSYSVAEKLITEGYTNVKVYAGGLKDWNQNGLPTFGASGKLAGFDVSEGAVERALTYQEWDKKLRSGEGVVVDVRRDDEVAEGKIKDSIHIPHANILAGPEQILAKLPEDKDTMILIHCKAGVRAGSVVNHIAGLGYNNTYFLDNGISISKDGEIEYEIDRGLTPEEFEEQLTEDGVTVVDVRSPEEVAEGKLEQSINIHVDLIEEDAEAIADQLPKDKNAKILIHCKAGVRAARAVDPIVELGYKNAYFLDHAITITKDGEYTFE